MTTLLAKNAHTLVTMDTTRREIPDGALFVRDHIIEFVGTTAEAEAYLQARDETPDETLNLTDHAILPGLINTHHHMFQSLLRAIPNAQNESLIGWIDGMTKYWHGFNPDMIYTSAQIAMAELILSGCTTTSDHLYMFANGSRLDDEIRAAQEIGMRFHPGRGSISINNDDALPPHLIEKEADIERDTIRLIDTYHDPERYAMLRIVIAPGAPFAVTHDFMRECSNLARSYNKGVRLHTHFLEIPDDITLLKEQTGLSPEGYLEEYGWAGDDVWHAHCVHLSDAGIDLFARTQTGVAHCPHSNMRLGSGAARVPQMRKAGVRVGLGVDGTASNDGGHILAETRQALMLARVANLDASALTAREALEIASLGSASVLGRDDIGALAPGMAADFIAINLNRLEYAGAAHDPIAAIVLCTPVRVDYSIIHGRVIVREGHLTTLDLAPVIRQQNQFARQLAIM